MKNTNYIEINDVYFISTKVKEFNPNYRLVYDKSSKMYCVIDVVSLEKIITTAIYPSSLIINKLHQTKRENFKKLFEFIEISNKKIEEKNQQNIKENASDRFLEIAKYAESKGDPNLSQTQIRKIIKE